MTINEEKEICREFREAKDKALQIEIISQLRCIGTNDVTRILKKYGYEIPRKKWVRKKKEPESKEKQEIPDIVKDTIFEKLEKIDKRIKELEPFLKEYETLEKQYKLLAQYLCS